MGQILGPSGDDDGSFLMGIGHLPDCELSEAIRSQEMIDHANLKAIEMQKLSIDGFEVLERVAYDDGYKAGLEAYAWSKDGVQYVGTCGMTLKEAVESRAKTFNYSPPGSPQK